METLMNHGKALILFALGFLISQASSAIEASQINLERKVYLEIVNEETAVKIRSLDHAVLFSIEVNEQIKNAIFVVNPYDTNCYELLVQTLRRRLDLYELNENGSIQKKTSFMLNNFSEELISSAIKTGTSLVVDVKSKFFQSAPLLLLNTDHPSKATRIDAGRPLINLHLSRKGNFLSAISYSPQPEIFLWAIKASNVEKIDLNKAPNFLSYDPKKMGYIDGTIEDAVVLGDAVLRVLVKIDKHLRLYTYTLGLNPEVNIETIVNVELAKGEKFYLSADGGEIKSLRRQNTVSVTWNISEGQITQIIEVPYEPKIIMENESSFIVSSRDRDGKQVLSLKTKNSTIAL